LNSNGDGFAEGPISLLRCIPQNFTYSYVRFIPKDLRAAILNFLLCHHKLNFLRDRHPMAVFKDSFNASGMLSGASKSIIS